MEPSKSSDDLVKLLNKELDSDPDIPLNPGDDEDVDKDEDASIMSQRKKKPKVELTKSGSDSHGSKLNGNSKETIADKSVEVDNCQHPGQKLGSQSGISFDYKQKAAPDKGGRSPDKYLKRLLESKKLYLVLDLDHTLLNSADYGKLTDKEMYLYNETEKPDIYKDTLYRVSSLKMFAKLRPFVHTFLKEASDMFEMSIYTLAKREYAEKMVKLLDPQDVYFGNRVIAEEDSSQKDQKGLDMVPVHESAVLILDATVSVWKNHLENLILMDKYHFFASSRKQSDLDGDKSHAVLRDDESEENRNLASILEVLKKVHGLFFGKEISKDHLNRDVRQILKEVKKEVLKGCKILFANVLPSDVKPEDDPVWKAAEELGASCLKEVDPTATHVIFGSVENQFLVSPGWLIDSLYALEKKPEEKYPVISQEVKKEQ